MPEVLAPADVRIDDRLFLIDRLVEVANLNDAMLDAWGKRILELVRSVACGEAHPLDPTLHTFLHRHFPDNDLVWTFVEKL